MMHEALKGTYNQRSLIKKWYFYYKMKHLTVDPGNRGSQTVSILDKTDEIQKKKMERGIEIEE